MLRQEKRSKKRDPEASEIIRKSPRRWADAKSPGAGTGARHPRGPCRLQSPELRGSRTGAGGPAVPLNRLRRHPPPPPPLSPAVCQPFPNPRVIELPHHGNFHWVRRRGCQTPGHKEAGNQPGLGVRGPRPPQPPRSAAAHAAAPRGCPSRRAPPPRGGARSPGGGRPAADTPPTPARPRARRRRSHPEGFPRHPRPPALRTAGTVAPAPPPPRRPLAELPGRWSRPGGAPPPGEAACGRCPSPELEGRFPGALALFMQS